MVHLQRRKCWYENNGCLTNGTSCGKKKQKKTKISDPLVNHNDTSYWMDKCNNLMNGTSSKKRCIWKIQVANGTSSTNKNA